MKKIKLDSFILEVFDYNIKEHLEMISFFDFDVEINKYIITSNDSFSDIINYYIASDPDIIYNKIYMVKLLTGEIIGSLELDGIKEDLYINYAILKKYRGNMYATRLLREITEYLLNEIDTISILIKNDNEKSKKLALSAGYKEICYDGYGYYKYQIHSQV